jgi:2-Cys peroxiredoxin 5
MSIAVGDRLPAGSLQEGSPRNLVDPAVDLSRGKLVLFGVPGAFTPGCSKTHLPGYLADQPRWAELGYTVACLSVNDAFVLQAWGEATGASGKVRLLGDPSAAYVRALGLSVEAAALGGTRSKRFALLAEDGVVTHLEVEPDGFGLTCSLSAPLLERAAAS